MQQSNPLIQFNLNTYGTLPALKPEFELNVYRITQEILYNIIKHAQATEVMLQINYYEKLLAITIKDNGKGFDEDEIKNKKSAGLKNIKARTNILNGKVEINSKKEEGTLFYLEFDVNLHINEERTNISH